MKIVALFAALAFAASASASTLRDCKATYGAALNAAGASAEARCEALVSLASCINDNLAAMTHSERLSAQGFVDAAKLTSACDKFAVPELQVELADQRERRADSDTISIWDISQKFDALVDSTVDKASFLDVQDTVLSLQASTTESMNKVREDILLIVEVRINKLAESISAAMQSTITQLQSVATTLNDDTVARILAVEDKYKTVATTIQNSILANITGRSDFVKTAVRNATTVVNTVDARLPVLEANITTRFNTAFGSTKVTTDSLMNAFSKSVVMNPRLPIFRYNTWHTYAQYEGWFTGNNGAFFGGVAPSTWSDGNGYAHQMSSDKNVLRTLFTKKMTPGWNANVKVDEWYSYSSTNGELTGALFRIRNTQSSAITWRTFWFYSSYGGWGEAASVAINGVNQWTTTNNCGYCSVNVDISIPANRVSTVIFVTSSGPQSGTRSNILIFYNDCLNLPLGLEYVDDLDYATGGWEA